MTIDEKALMTLSAGVYILGTQTNNKKSGCIIDTAMQVAFTFNTDNASLLQDVQGFAHRLL